MSLYEISSIGVELITKMSQHRHFVAQSSKENPFLTKAGWQHLNQEQVELENIIKAIGRPIGEAKNEPEK